MRRLNKIFATITVSILILFSIGVVGTYISEYLSSINWFGDRGSNWGPRHYWYNFLIAALFIVSLVRAITNTN